MCISGTDLLWQLCYDLVLWEPTHGKKNVGGQAGTFRRSAGGGHRGPQRLLAGSDG